MPVVDHLHAEHAEIRSTLSQFEAELDTFEVEGSADFEAMKDALIFVTSNPNLMHHHGERLIYQRVAERDHNTSSLVDELLARHDELQREGEALLEDVEDMAEDVMVPKDSFDLRAHEYLDGQLEHMEREDRELLPLAERVLTPEDWREIEQALRKR